MRNSGRTFFKQIYCIYSGNCKIIWGKPTEKRKVSNEVGGERERERRRERERERERTKMGRGIFKGEIENAKRDRDRKVKFKWNEIDR